MPCHQKILKTSTEEQKTVQFNLYATLIHSIYMIPSLYQNLLPLLIVQRLVIPLFSINVSMSFAPRNVRLYFYLWQRPQDQQGVPPICLFSRIIMLVATSRIKETTDHFLNKRTKMVTLLCNKFTIFTILFLIISLDEHLKARHKNH